VTATHTTEVPHDKFEAGNYERHSMFGDEIAPLDCEWTQDNIFSHLWHTECGTEFELPEHTPGESKWWYCPSCGGLIYPVQTQFDEEES